MKEHGPKRTGHDDPGHGAAAAMPSTLIERCRVLAEAMERIVATPLAVTLNERQKGEGLGILHKLVDAIEIDLRYFVGTTQDPAPIAWQRIAPRGLPIAGLADLVLARVIENDFDIQDGHGPGPAFIADDAALAALWTAYLIAERRRRNAWTAPMLPLSDLPLEMHARLVECVAGALLASETSEDPGTNDRLAAMVAAAGKATQLHREEISIDVAAVRFVDAALASRSCDRLLVDLIACRAWPAIAALIAERTGGDRTVTVIALANASSDNIADWLAPAGFSVDATAVLVRALALSGGAPTLSGATEHRDDDTSKWPGKRDEAIAYAARRYRGDTP